MKAYERLLNYVMYSTMSDENSKTVPSTAGQIEFAKALVEEIKALGIDDVSLDAQGYVYGSVASNLEEGAWMPPVVGFIAHLDTVSDYPGPSEDQPPRVIQCYEGGRIQLTAELCLDPETDENLRNSVGDGLIVTSGKTLLGGDDKAGVAEIVTALEYLVEHPEFRHGKIAFAFTPDEEIGTSQDCFNVEKFGAQLAFTLDGGDFDEMEYENFNAATAQIRIRGINTHPGYAKNKMRNASVIAAELHAMLPAWERPEHTEGYEGYFHLSSIEGCCDSCKMSYIIRDLDGESFLRRKELIRSAVQLLNQRYGENTVELELKDSYRNMAEMVKPHMHMIEFAKDGIRACGGSPKVNPMRGGTDGAVLSYKGVPCPNLGTGSFNHHSLSEFANIRQMDQCVELILYIADRYATTRIQ